MNINKLTRKTKKALKTVTDAITAAAVLIEAVNESLASLEVATTRLQDATQVTNQHARQLAEVGKLLQTHIRDAA